MRLAIPTAMCLEDRRALYPVHGSTHTGPGLMDVFCGRCELWLGVPRTTEGFRPSSEEWLAEHEAVMHADHYACQDCPSRFSLDSDGPRLHLMSFPTHRIVVVREEG